MDKTEFYRFMIIVGNDAWGNMLKFLIDKHNYTHQEWNNLSSQIRWDLVFDDLRQSGIKVGEPAAGHGVGSTLLTFSPAHVTMYRIKLAGYEHTSLGIVTYI